ncbi:gustatory receptor 68a-like [Harmonia axyridis]|uniref:gustatory receptor 68a-like n=1 Tax=Harmonia axyridis TaxID=115357 RepID=UPI001E27811A|nr:gustatory receptor 68a-like [Harmonia axyridis]
MLHISWRRKDMDSYLMRWFSIYTIFISFYFILNFYWHTQDLENNLTNLCIICRELSSRDQSINDNTSKITILCFVLEIFFFVLMMVAELLMVVKNDIQFDWSVYPMIHSARLFDILFQAFYLHISVKRLILMKTILHFCKNTDDFENVRDIVDVRFKLNRNNQDFIDFFAGSIIIRCGFSAFSILLDIYSAFQLFVSKDTYEPIASGLILSSDLLVQIFTVSIFICFGMGFADKSKETVEVINDKQRKLGRNNLPYKSMELFLLNSKLNHLDVSVGGFFPLNWTLIYSMVSCISTYLVYLIQFREVEMQKKSD